MLALAEFASDIWVADGPAVSVAGPFTLPTRMIVVKLGDGSLWVNSPIEATPADMDCLARLGPVRYLVAPTPLHAWRLAAWNAHFSQAQTWGPPGTSLRRSQYDGILADEPPAAWSADLDQMVFRGNPFVEEVEFFHRRSRTVIATDFVQIYAPQDGRAWLNTLMRFAGVLGGGVPLDIRLSFLRRSLGRRSLRKLLRWDFDKLIVAHGRCLRTGAKPFVEDAFRWLERPG